jgi:fructokinase
MILAVHKKIGCNEVNFRKNLYDFPMVRQSLNLANIVKMNQQEFTEIVEMFSLPKNHKKGLDSLIKKFQPKMYILTLGDKGAIMATKKEYKVFFCSPLPWLWI